MDECVYFTRRNVGEGKVMAWAFRGKCPKCKKGLMGKPRDGKTGKVKVRAKEYVCPECDHTVEKKEYEESLTGMASYTCPACKKKGEAEFPFKRKTYKGVKAFVFDCQHCGEKIPVTKKMKEGKSKKKKGDAVPDDI